jgi:hypothetical protein
MQDAVVFTPDEKHGGFDPDKPVFENGDSPSFKIPENLLAKSVL